ncbi:MAG: DUF3291 domain-containing protein [Rhodothermales bacterium]|nr:DUF3291 domain-containing protein [Rhodothermales bacterium]
MATRLYLAQANIATGIAPLDHPSMKSFVDKITFINEAAENAPGFVWRFQTEEGDATGVRIYGDSRIIFNMSVWVSIDDLKWYTYNSDHLSVFKRRKEWFSKMSRPHSVLWWIHPSTRPTVEDALEKLAALEKDGPRPDAFTFSKLFDASGKALR